MIPAYPSIYLYKGCSKDIEFDLSEFPFAGGTVMLTVKCGENTFQAGFTEPQKYVITIPAELTKTFENVAYYDLIWHTEDKVVPLCAPSMILILNTVGGVIDGDTD